METRICTDMKKFFAEHQVSARKLAMAAGINPATITTVLTGKRQDMTAEKADKVRAAMERIAEEQAAANA